MSSVPERLALGAVVVIASLAVTATSYAHVLGESRLFVVAPVGLLAGAGLVALAAARFEVFVLAVLGARTSLDAFKLVGVGIPDPSALLGMLFSGVAVVWLVDDLRHGHPERRLSRLSWAGLTFGAVALLGVLTSPEMDDSLIEWSRLASIVLMLLVAERLADEARWRRQVVATVGLAAVTPLTVAAYQLATDTNLFAAGGFDRIRGTFMHSNPLAAFLVLLSVGAVAVVLHDDVRRHRLLAGVVAAPALVALFLTYTRAAWLAAALGLAIVAALRGWRAVAPLLVAVVLVVLLVPGVALRFSDLTEGETSRGEPGNSLSWRVGYWTSALGLADEAPVSGVGLKQVAARTVEAKQPHNDFVRTYVELGVAGLAAYCFLVWQYLATALRAGRGARGLAPGLDRSVLAAFAGIAVGYALMGLVMNLITQVVVGMYFYALAGLAVAVLHRLERPERPAAEQDVTALAGRTS